MRKAIILLVPTLTLLLTVILCPTSVLAEHLFDIDGVQMTPSQLHEIMAKGKAEALQRSRDAARLTASAAASTQTNYDVLSYDIFIRVNDTTEILYGSVGFVAKATESGVSEVEVDFYIVPTKKMKLTAMAYCTKHGLWQSDEVVVEVA